MRISLTLKYKLKKRTMTRKSILIILIFYKIIILWTWFLWIGDSYDNVFVGGVDGAHELCVQLLQILPEFDRWRFWRREERPQPPSHYCDQSLPRSVVGQYFGAGPAAARQKSISDVGPQSYDRQVFMYHHERVFEFPFLSYQECKKNWGGWGVFHSKL